MGNGGRKLKKSCSGGGREGGRGREIKSHRGVNAITVHNEHVKTHNEISCIS